jgi:hypothetical protein
VGVGPGVSLTKETRLKFETLSAINFDRHRR